MYNDSSWLSACRPRYELPCKQAGNEKALQRAPLHVHLVYVRLDVGKFICDFVHTKIVLDANVTACGVEFDKLHFIRSARDPVAKASRNAKSAA